MKLNLQPLLTLEEVADQMHLDGDFERRVSRERIRQIESSALKKLERGLRKKGYTLADLIDGAERDSEGEYRCEAA